MSLPITRLGNTGLKVSRLALGTMQFGWTADAATAFDILDAYREAGGNLIDTADIYSRWAEGNPGGVSEEIIGDWLAKRGCRAEMIVATKVRGRMGTGPNDEGLSRAHVMNAVEASLRRMKVDHIDLYQTHFFDADTPIEETLRALDDLVRSGKVRYIGCSNYPAWRLVESLWTSDRHDLGRYAVLQPHYNLAHRAEFERELGPVCKQFGIGVIPYSPLAGGFLTGKYRLGAALPSSARAKRIEEHYLDERGAALIEALDEVADSHATTLPRAALAWLLSRPEVTAPIVGANAVAQLEDLLPAAELRLTEEALHRLDEVSAWT